MSTATLLISCPDRPGLVAAVTQFIAAHRGNILHLDQHVDAEADTFFMRVEWDMSGSDLTHAALDEAFSAVAAPFTMRWRIARSDETPRMAVFVSKEAHCLYEILSRHEAGEWRVALPLIISNHPTLEPIAARFGVPFVHIPVTREGKAQAESQQIALLHAHQIDLVVLARYMQILSPAFVDAFPERIINIHHSFLPAFAGAKPYHAAFARGVKLIGATSHYVTADLDAGPIIAQETVHVTHRDSIDDLIRRGRDVEKLVLSRAIRAHLDNRILVYANKTVVFE
jgi:formyltetrahydrofolate deformylase